MLFVIIPQHLMKSLNFTWIHYVVAFFHWNLNAIFSVVQQEYYCVIGFLHFGIVCLIEVYTLKNSWNSCQFNLDLRKSFSQLFVSSVFFGSYVILELSYGVLFQSRRKLLKISNQMRSKVQMWMENEFQKQKTRTKNLIMVEAKTKLSPDILQQICTYSLEEKYELYEVNKRKRYVLHYIYKVLFQAAALFAILNIADIFKPLIIQHFFPFAFFTLFLNVYVLILLNYIN